MPGNVRELENTIERCVIITDGNYIDVEDFPLHIKALDTSKKIEMTGSLFVDENIIPFEKIKEEAIRHALKVTKGNILEAARKLKLGRATIYRLMERYKVNSKEFEN